MSVDILSGMTLIRGAVQTLSGATPNNSALIDRRGFEGLAVYLETGTVTDAGTASGFTMKLQESDTTAAADFADVADADTVTVVTDAANGILAGAISYAGSKRYVRAVFTGTTGTNATVQILAALGANSNASAPVTSIGATTAAT